MRLAIFFFLSLAVLSCKSERQIIISPKAELHFGNAGGIANAKNEFILTVDGKLYQRMNEGPKKLINDLGAKKGVSVLKEAVELGLDSLDFKHPGNMTHFIIVNNGKKTNEVSWGDPQNTPASDIKSFYDKLMELRP